MGTQQDNLATSTADQQVEALHGIAHAAIQHLPLAELLARIVDEIRRRFSWEFVGIASIDADEGVAILQAWSADLPPAMDVGHRQSLETGIVGEVAQSGEPRFVPAIDRDQRYIPTVPSINAELCLPVLQGDVVVAVLNAESAEADRLRGQTEFLETVCDLIAGAFETDRQRQRLRRQAALLEVTTAVSRLAMRGERLEQMLQLTVDYVAHHLPVSVASILMLNEAGTHFAYEVCAGELSLHIQEDWPTTVGVAGRCARTGMPQLVADIEQDADYVPGHEDVRSEYLVPIAWRDRVLGVLNLESVESDTFTPETQRIFRGVADQIAGIAHLLGVRADLEESNRRLDRLTRLDGLTGVANRREFDDVLDRHWRAEEPFCLAMVDIDHFKALNDTHGHLYGDDCLVRVAGAIVHALAGEQWLVSRFGGEEFAVVLPNLLLEDAVGHLERVRTAIEDLAMENRGAPRGVITASVGVACRESGDRGADDLVARADDALYQAKDRGRNRTESINRKPTDPGVR